MSTPYDIIVIGTGSMGAAACYYAAKQGLSVLGLDQFAPPHNLGSHSGQSRIIRQAYFEHPDYVPLLQRSYVNWAALEAEAGKTLIHKSGLLYLGKKQDRLINGVRTSAEEYGLNIDELGETEKTERFPGMYFPKELTAVYEPNAGYLLADEAIRTILNLAKRNGAELRSNEKVISWELRNNHVVVFTASESFHAKKIIVTCGAYAQQLLPRLRNTLRVTRQSVFWFAPKEPELFKAPQFTCWNIDDPDYSGLFYGFPYVDEKDNAEYYGLKIAYHHPGEVAHPSAASPENEAKPKKQELEMLRSIISKYFPKALGPMLRHQTCFYTNSTDEHFIIDELPNTEGRVIFGAGFSGHGFKFISGVGEILVEKAMEEKRKGEVGFLGLGRFED